ncbi:hypothetical protein GCM10009872_43240 [Actinopolymorpha rutila]
MLRRANSARTSGTGTGCSPPEAPSSCVNSGFRLAIDFGEPPQGPLDAIRTLFDGSHLWLTNVYGNYMTAIHS